MNPRATGRYPRARPSGEASTASPEGDNHVWKHRLIFAETYHELPNDFTDQPCLIALIGVNGTVEPFKYIAFHGGRNDD